MKTIRADDHKWHCDYIQLAWDSGFSFGKYQYPNIDKYKICLVDIDRIIRERDVASVENQIPTILQFTLDNDQANVLDQNFVKVFRMSQLSVEYLLFCKNYLDNLIISMEKEISDLKQEKKEFKMYMEEMETHLSANTSNLISTFKCDKCSKVFSSENYLTSHFKRRHDEENMMKKNSETEKLYFEIRELRERLNYTEKIIKDKANEAEPERSKMEEYFSTQLVDDIQKNFGNFKEQVENKIEHFQTEKEFFNEKYERLFNALLQYKNKEDEQVEEKQVTENKSVKESAEKIGIAECATQTDDHNKSSNLKIESIDTVNTITIKETFTEDNNITNEHDLNYIVDQKLNSLGVNIESRISNGLLNIQNQMEGLSEKLLQLEENRHQSRKIQRSTVEEKPQLGINKPMIKPRTRFSKPTTLARTFENEAEKLKSELNEMLSKHTVESHVGTVKHQTKSTTESESETDSEVVNIMEPVQVQKVQPKTTNILKNKREDPSKKHVVSEINITSAEIEKKKEQVKNEINNVMLERLQEMGISPQWNGVPKKTFERALNIVRHQASKNKKYFPDYDKLKHSIENSLKQENELESESKHKRNQNKPNLIKIGYRQKKKEQSKSKPTTSRPLVLIKNRSLYDTDSERELEENLPPTEIENVQKAAVEEITVWKSEDTDSDLKSLVLSYEEDKIETKSAMKTYSSDGSLVKKKVLFDIEQLDTIVAGQTFDKGNTMKNTDSSLSDFGIS